jgi:hypothetical protein
MAVRVSSWGLGIADKSDSLDGTAEDLTIGVPCFPCRRRTPHPDDKKRMGGQRQAQCKPDAAPGAPRFNQI